LFAALFGVIVSLGIAATAIQTSVAGRVASTDPSQHRTLIAGLIAAAVGWTVVVAAGMAALSPAVERLLHVGSIVPVLAAGAVAASLVPWSVSMGIFQGQQRFHAFGALTLFQACARLTAGLTLIWSRDLTTLLIAVAVAVLVPLAVSVALLGDLRPNVAGVWSQRRTWAGALTGGRAVFGWTLLTVLVTAFPTVGDVVVVRHVYDAHQAGLYAGAALVGRCVLFLPVGINSVLYSRYLTADSDAKRTHLRNQGLAASLGLCGLAALVLGADPRITLTVIVGSGYGGAESLLRIYLLASFGFAIASNFAFFQLARGNKRFALTLLLPHLAAIAVLPFVLASDLKALTVGIAVVAASLLVTSAMSSRSAARR
jgi:O-antigen/teichoic acid export membrane protein